MSEAASSISRPTYATPRQMQAEVVSQHEVAHRHYRLVLHAPAIAVDARPGHFIHVLPHTAYSFDPLLRRAFSILRAAPPTLEILYRIEGRGTALMAGFAPGAMVDILGPLGVPFAPLAPDSLLVGGGVGVPPMAMLASQRRDERITALIGARSADELICLDDFAAYEVPVEVSTDDGSRGHHGRVTELLEAKLLQARQVADQARPTVFACGPFAMLRAVAALTAHYEVPCQVSLEENMPCGVGVCNGCVVPVLGAGDDYGSYRRICVDGPVLWAHEVNWSPPISDCRLRIAD